MLIFDDIRMSQSFQDMDFFQMSQQPRFVISNGHNLDGVLAKQDIVDYVLAEED